MFKSVLILLFVASAALPIRVHAQAETASEGLTETFFSVHLARGSDLNTIVSKKVGANPTTAVFLFPGYPGVLKIRNDGGKLAYDLRGNFVIRARRHISNDNLFTVMIDCPKDQWNGCGDAYRSSDQHANDVSEVMEKIKADFGARRIYILGTSYGTMSTSFLALKLGGKIDGAVHTATFTDPQRGRDAHGVPMANFDWASVKAKQLFVHHRDDPCSVTRYNSVLARKGDAPLITVLGSRGANGPACEARTAHGFAGRERAVMLAIADWIATRKVQEKVGEDKVE
jgi:pimeloyl-ACP methyl ester carboxylesterase